jgi:hypothetical protein
MFPGKDFYLCGGEGSQQASTSKVVYILRGSRLRYIWGRQRLDADDWAGS